ncbi:juvenile hormone esterase-like [Cylas formicarius]|uniref:juvenile hormone esterase-like n=1 Tax=Cylas formicarius TaxID=197179 RepID=UPI002958880F|nr:juvenile hormone esterase-like [Cylas formicarius]
MFLLCIFLAFLVPPISSQQPIVVLPNGTIQGHALTTFTGREYLAFQGVPYAAPPTGTSRFQAPRPHDAWNGTLDATKESAICFQLQSDSDRENEDCLYVNVFTPNTEAQLPVIFWIYGGGFRNGAASFASYRPDYLIDEDVVLVTHNYRVGIFGFLSTGDRVIPGNYGLKDQQLALRWTYENIHLFGGDPARITIMGQSAGAASVGYHLLNPNSAGLFGAAIAESGSPLNMWSFIEDPRAYAIDLAQAVDVDFDVNATSDQLGTFFMGLDARTIDAAGTKTKIVQPAVVLEADGPTAFVSTTMYEQFDVGDFAKVPTLMGMTSEEGISAAKSTKYLNAQAESYDSDPALLLPDIFHYGRDADVAVIGNAIKEIYVGNDTFADRLGAVVRHFSDNRYDRAVMKQARMISPLTTVYFYQFSYDGALGGVDYTAEGADRVGHGEELNYLFLSREVETVDDGDALTHKRLVRLWTNFVKYLNPTPESDDPLLQNVTWPIMTADSFPYLDIDADLTTKTNPKQRYYEGWDRVFAAYGVRPYVTF